MKKLQPAQARPYLLAVVQALKVVVSEVSALGWVVRVPHALRGVRCVGQTAAVLRRERTALTSEKSIHTGKHLPVDPVRPKPLAMCVASHTSFSVCTARSQNQDLHRQNLRCKHPWVEVLHSLQSLSGRLHEAADTVQARAINEWTRRSCIPLGPGRVLRLLVRVDRSRPLRSGQERAASTAKAFERPTDSCSCPSACQASETTRCMLGNLIGAACGRHRASCRTHALSLNALPADPFERGVLPRQIEEVLEHEDALARVARFSPTGELLAGGSETHSQGPGTRLGSHSTHSCLPVCSWHQHWQGAGVRPGHQGHRARLPASQVRRAANAWLWHTVLTAPLQEGGDLLGLGTDRLSLDQRLS